MNIVLAGKEEFDGKNLCLSDRRAEHIIKVLKSKVGDRIRLGEIDGPQGYGVIARLETKKPYMVELDTSLTAPVEKPADIDLILALPRPIMLRRILGQVASLGVGSIFLINSNRVEKSFWQATILEEGEYRGLLLQGLEQAVATRVPKIRIYRRFRPFVEDVAPDILQQYRYRLLAHPTIAQTVDPVLPERGKTILAIGPEGGWVDFEIEKFSELGFAGFNLGARILKVDTAVVAAHARLSMMLEQADLLENLQNPHLSKI